jgi:hypothetical protein
MLTEQITVTRFRKTMFSLSAIKHLSVLTIIFGGVNAIFGYRVIR